MIFSMLQCNIEHAILFGPFLSMQSNGKLSGHKTFELNHEVKQTTGWTQDKFLEYFSNLIPELINSGSSEDQQNYIYSVEKDEIVAFLSNYLENCNCTLILSEKHYIDKEYLADFAIYHLKAFAHYKKTCSRIHFFTGFSDYEIDDFKRDLLLSTSLVLSRCYFQEHYLGFVVVKPLPNEFIGRTCIKPGFQAGANLFTSKYTVNIHRMELKVHSLPFQAQDPAIGKCASVSLWCALKGASKIFEGQVIPNIGKITELADKIVPTTHRVYPSSGLRAIQMVQVIKQFDLDVEYRDVYNPSFTHNMKDIIKGYCAIKLPAILLLKLNRGSNINADAHTKSCSCTFWIQTI